MFLDPRTYIVSYEANIDFDRPVLQMAEQFLSVVHKMLEHQEIEVENTPRPCFLAVPYSEMLTEEFYEAINKSVACHNEVMKLINEKNENDRIVSKLSKLMGDLDCFHKSAFSAYYSKITQCSPYANNLNFDNVFKTELNFLTAEMMAMHPPSDYFWYVDLPEAYEDRLKFYLNADTTLTALYSPSLEHSFEDALNSPWEFVAYMSGQIMMGYCLNVDQYKGLFVEKGMNVQINTYFPNYHHSETEFQQDMKKSNFYDDMTKRSLDFHLDFYNLEDDFHGVSTIPSPPVNMIHICPEFMRLMGVNTLS